MEFGSLGGESQMSKNFIDSRLVHYGSNDFNVIAFAELASAEIDIEDFFEKFCPTDACGIVGFRFLVFLFLSLFQG